MTTPALEAQRLILRKFTGDDLPALHRIYSGQAAVRLVEADV
ncbi:MAG: GNAT family N-acetyltransferase [Oscillospiraceae bacterium]|nr:GNAT family N-acetyltransferase [Oscillospiraceae bacterium]